MTDASCREARKNNGRTLKHEPRKRDKVSRKNGAAEKIRGGHASFKKRGIQRFRPWQQSGEEKAQIANYKL